MTRIYTRTGDAGTTALGDGTRVPKTDLRLAAFADVDEANSAIGVALALGGLAPDVVELLTAVQNDLFDVGADLCRPLAADEPPDGDPQAPLRVRPAYVAALEEACDRYNEPLPPLRSFVLPGGTPGAALLHVARTVTRRAERSTWAAVEALGTGDGGVSPAVVQYLNRLSDLLFILCRHANLEHGDVLWKPGG
nr:cob(I)yrinic acid a,c-diamide adenosyltransferase [Motilibacter deserti]